VDAFARTVETGGNVMPWFILVLVIAAFALVYIQARASWWLACMIVWVAAAHVSGAAGPVLTTLLAIVLVLPALVLTLKPLRRIWLTKPVLEIFRKILPEMSPTERDAIEAPNCSRGARTGTRCSATAPRR
jgi:acyl-CoA dehydrogenase